jgi:hypothetical protein
MSKTLFAAAFVMASMGGADAKVRPLYPSMDNYEASLIKSHDRIVRSPLAESFPVQTIDSETGSPVVQAGTSTS